MQLSRCEQEVVINFNVTEQTAWQPNNLIDELAMPIGSLLKEVDNRNMNGSIKNVQGINITKQFMPSVANTNGVDLSKYKVVNKGQFVFSGMQTGRDKCIRIALFDKVEPIIISPA